MTARFCVWSLVLAIMPIWVSGEVYGQRLRLLLGPEAAALEKKAASELRTQFTRLFDVKWTSEQSAGTATHLVLIGSPTSNPAVRRALGSQWPQLSDQGIVIRSVTLDGLPAVIVGGGSPVATLWAVYELGHRFGIRYLLRGDIYPDVPQPLKLDDWNLVLEPSLRTRTWRTVNDFAIGPESWGLADHQRLLRQLAKMKFNRLMISLYPWQPFVHYEFRGVKKQTALLWYGEQYRVDGDIPGRVAFGGKRLFTNPDIPAEGTYEQKTAAAARLARGIIDAAHQLGMSVGISISPLEFPREFAKVLPGARDARSLNRLLVAPGSQQAIDDPLLKELVATKIRAYLTTYPTLDSLYLTLPEFPEWQEHAEAAWQRLSQRHDVGDFRLEDLARRAAQRPLIASGKRGLHALRGNLVTLAFLSSLLEDASLLQRPDGRTVRLVVTQVDPDLYPLLDRILPPQASALHFVDYTARRVVENRKYLAAVPASRVASRLILTLADDNVGVLSQSAIRRLETLVEELKRLGWDGFSTRYWMLAELDPSVHYLSRAAFDPRLTARAAHDDLFVTITGKQSVADRLWRGFGHIEAATELIDRHQLGFAFPVPGLLMKHERAEPHPDWWQPLVEHYNQSMIELYRSRDAAHPRARNLLYYYAKRSEYVLDYLNAVQALREAAVAAKAGDDEKQLEQLETAVESLYNAIDTLGDVAGDPSDRGLIAVLNAYAYQPLLQRYERAVEAVESSDEQ